MLYSFCASFSCNSMPCSGSSAFVWRQSQLKKKLFESSAASRCILAPFEQHGPPKKRTPKSSCKTFSIYISRKNWIKYSLRILKNKKFTGGTHILPQMHWTSNNFGNSATTTMGGGGGGGDWGITKLSNP